MTRLGYNASSGRLRLATSGRLGLCDECVYTASDGSEYSDSFSSTAGWSTIDASDSLKIVGGHLVFTDELNVGVLKYAYRPRSIVGTLDRLIMEVEVYQQLLSQTTGMFWYLNATPIFRWALFARWSFGNYGIYEDGVFITGFSGTNPTPAPGDKLTMDLSYDGSDTLACFFVNETLVHQKTVTGDQIGSGTTERYGLQCSPSGGSAPRDIGEWDNFALQLEITP